MVCRQSLAKQDMLRLVVDDEGQVWPDLMQKAPGRGVYHCMNENCLVGMSDKRLQALRSYSHVTLPQWDVLLQRMQSMLEQQLKRMFTRQRASAAIGRDAVMHRLWNNAPLLLLRAGDAGTALVRQMDDGLKKRAQSGCRSVLVNVASRQWLGEMFGRDDVAIVAVDAAGAAVAVVNRLHKYCVWYGRIKIMMLQKNHESRVSG